MGLLSFNLVACILKEKPQINEYEAHLAEEKLDEGIGYIDNQPDPDNALPDMDLNETNLVFDNDEGHGDSDVLCADGLVYIGRFQRTGYCDCEICQGPWVGTTALGMAPTPNNTIAVDPDIIPLGSYVWMDGQRYHAEDTGSAIIGYKVDIFVGSHEECYEPQYNGYVDVYLEVGE